jgi:hypothetical protein
VYLLLLPGAMCKSLAGYSSGSGHLFLTRTRGAEDASEWSIVVARKSAMGASLCSICNALMLPILVPNCMQGHVFYQHLCLRVEDATVKLLMAANPQVHNWHTLTCIFNRSIPSFFYKPSYSIL